MTLLAIHWDLSTELWNLMPMGLQMRMLIYLREIETIEVDIKNRGTEIKIKSTKISGTKRQNISKQLVLRDKRYQSNWY